MGFSMSDLQTIVPVGSTRIGSDLVPTVSARSLHAFLESKQDFSTWIKARIEQYGFQKDADFLVVQPAPQENGALESVRYPQWRIEYYLTMDMAKELAMVERNAKGKEIRQYFIECERRAIKAAQFRIPQDYPSALRALADETERRQQAEQELEASRPKIAFHDQVTHDSGTLIDWVQAFSLLKRRTGQGFTTRTFLDFLRRHGIACQPNLYANIGRDRFRPRKNYINTWFVSELTPTGGVEWMMRPYAISEVVRLIEKERTGAAMVAGYLEN